MEEAWELQDWELLQNSETGLSIPSDSSERDFGGTEEVEEVSEGIITANYFALDSEKRFEKKVVEDLVEEGSNHSENPSWVDPSYRFQRKNSSEFWSDSGSDGSGSQKNRDFEGKEGVGFQRIEEIGEFRGKSLDFGKSEGKRELDFGGNEEIEKIKGKSLVIGSFEGKQDLALGANEEIGGFEEKNAEFGKFWPDSGREDAKTEVGFDRIDEIGGLKGKSVEFGNFLLDLRGDTSFRKEFEGVGSEGNSGFGEMVHGWEFSSEKEVVKGAESSAGLLEVRGGIGYEKFEEIGESKGAIVEFGKFWSDSGGNILVQGLGDSGSEKIEQIGEYKRETVDFDKFWEDSGSDTLVQVKIGAIGGEVHSGFGEMGDRSESGRSIVEAGGGDGLEAVEFVEGGSGESGVEKIEQIEEFKEKIVEFGEVRSDMGSETSVQEVIGGVEGEGSLGVGEKGDELESSGGGVVESGGYGSESSELVEGVRVESADGTAIESGEGEKKRMVWWKLPFEMLKFCVFRVSPVWSVSIAAAVMGLVILGRRLRKMKKKSRSIPLRITVEDKKVSQFMARAARLNEAFSVVRRVPIVRPSLPATGVTPWPVMGLR